MACIRKMFSKWKAGVTCKWDTLSAYLYSFTSTELKSWLETEGGLSMRVAYPINFFPDKNMPRSNMSRAASDQGLTVQRLEYTLWGHPVSDNIIVLYASFQLQDSTTSEVVISKVVKRIKGISIYESDLDTLSTDECLTDTVSREWQDVHTFYKVTNSCHKYTEKCINYDNIIEIFFIPGTECKG